MKVTVLASGSKGNCTLIETDEHKILIDLGTSSLACEKKLKEIDVDPKQIDSIFITHAHKDHTAGINVFYKKYKPNIYVTTKMAKEASLNVDNFIELFEEREIGDYIVTPIPTSHDAIDSRGYIFKNKEFSVVYITDTGYINEKYFDKLKNRDVYVMESNHDIELLMNNPHYPHYLKMRILGDEGHLSNKDSALYLSKFIGSNTKKVFLAHLSEENNTPELAYDNLCKTLKSKNVVFENISIAKQNEVSETIVL